MVRIGSEQEFGVPPDTTWTITLTGGPNDGEELVSVGYWDSCPSGMWVTEIAKVDTLEVACPECGGTGWRCPLCHDTGKAIMLAEEFHEPVQLRYELVPRSEDFDARTARFRYVELS